MEKSNSTRNGFAKIIGSFVFLMLFAFNQHTYAQCSLGLNTNTQISLDEFCEALITPEMVLNDQTTSCPGGIFSANVKDLNEVIIPTSPIVTGDYVNQQLIVEVVDENSGNVGWGYLYIEDKLAPVITCADVTVSCTNSSNYEPTVIDACDPNPTWVLLTSQATDLPCDVDFIETITNTYQATDRDGNVSAICTQVITVERIPINSIVFPDDLSVGNSNAIDCDDDVLLDDAGIPIPALTGTPTLDGVSLYPTTDLACNTIVDYDDMVLSSIGGVQKIMRTWTATEWFCNGSVVVSDIQLIEIIDDEGPVISNCPVSYTASTTSGTDCEAIVLLPALNAVDACGTVGDVDVVYPGGFLNNQNGGLVYLPIGSNTITYTVYDNNNNSSTCSYVITVEDNTAPVVVCDQNTVVGLALDGTAIVNAFSFDDGSYDDCSDVEFSVKRMDNGQNCSFDPFFGPTVTFCCADIGTDVMVQLLVTDANGNTNQCMVSVEVQDKLAPTITCPASVTVDCDMPFDINNLDLDFGTATANDNCSVTVVEGTPFVNINSCNEGTITRFFTATDPNGSASCAQTITFVNNEPFAASDITFPTDMTMSECVSPESLGPDITGFPIISDDACDQVGVDYDDKIFTVISGDDACFKILRTWEVLDWCQTNANGSFVTYTGIQTIKVINTVAPTFDGDYPDLQECTFDNECLEGNITLGAAATDECIDQLNYSFNIDFDNDGSFDVTSGVTVGTSIDASGTYPIGNHRIVYTVEDGCGNSDVRTQLFSIVNCKAPTPYCLNGLNIELMPIDSDGDGEADSGMIETWASDFDAGSFHSCGLDVVVSFSANPLDTGRMYTCDDVGDNTVEIWAHVILPNGDILQDFCTANLGIQDNMGVCDGGSTSTLVVIEGDIKTENAENADQVDVTLLNGEVTTATNEFGAYSFPAMITGGNYEVVPNKTEQDKLNGITTLDIVLIQKHILGLEILDTPYKVIAADVNKDEKVTGQDIINLRKLILGVDSELVDNKDWRFVDQDYSFINPSNPLNENFTETYVINQLNSNMSVDFVAVKVGDVNNTAAVNLTSEVSETRSNETLTFMAIDREFGAGETVRMDVTVADAIDYYGMQYTLKFNNMILNFEGVEAGILDLDESNLGLNNLDLGAVTTSWSASELKSVDVDDVLFTLVFSSKSEGQLSGNIAINSEITSSEAYDANLEVMDMKLEFRNDSGQEIESSPFALFPNIPNPFAESTNISFNLPTASTATLSVFDVSGKLIYTQSGAYTKGMNTIVLNVGDFSASGVLYYQIETKGHMATRKMVVLK